MTKPGNTFAEELKRCDLSQRAFIRLVAFMGNGQPPPVVTTVNRWACGHLEPPAQAFAILNLYQMLSPSQRESLKAQIGVRRQ